MSFKKSFLLYKIFLLIFVFSFQLAFGEEISTKDNPQEPLSLFTVIERFVKKIEFVTALKTAYDSNIFLSEDEENSDIINIFTQNLSLKLPHDQFYLQLDYTGNLSYYIEEGDNTSDQTANFLFSYRPFNYFSFGVGNYFQKMHSKKIITTFEDKLLSMGYKQDTPTFEVKIEPAERWIIDSGWQYYYLDADATTDDYIDRGDNIANISANYEFWPELFSFFGCGYQDAHFPHLTSKDTESYRSFFGFTRKFNKFNLISEVGQEYKETSLQGNDENTDFKIGLNSTFSVYTILNLNFTFNKSRPSARKEYLQYFEKSIETGFWHLVTPKLSLSANLRYEKEEFDSSDVLSGNPYLDKTTDMYSATTSLTRKINDWLSTNLGYSFVKRNSDFASEGYTDNKISFGIIASY